MLTATAALHLGASAAVAVTLPRVGLPPELLVSPGLDADLPGVLNLAAPAGGLTVSLAAADESVATVTPTIIIPEGAIAGNAAIHGVAVRPTTITASASGYEPDTTALLVGDASVVLDPPED